MKPITKTLLCTASLVAGLAGPAAYADDLTVVSNVTTRGKSSTSTAYFTDTAMRTSDGRNDVIIDFGAERMVTIDHKKKTWTEVTFAEMREKMKELEEMLGDNPMVASMLGGASEASVQKLGSERQVAGHTCQDYRVTMGSGMRFDLCAAPSIVPPLDIFEARKMAGLMMGPMAARMNKLYDAMAELDGFPLVTETEMKMMGVNMSTSQVATEVKTGVPADAFDLPTSYKKKKSPLQ